MPHEEDRGVCAAAWAGLLFLLRCCCPCIWPAPMGDRPRGDSYGNLLEARGQRLLSGQQESAIEATSTSPPRLPPTERTALLAKGQGHSSSEGEATQARGASDAAAVVRPSSKGSSSPEGSESPRARAKHKKSDSKLSLLDDEDMCAVCLEHYSEDNPKVLTRCGHGYHLQCIFELLERPGERSRDCPVCSSRMEFEQDLGL